MPVPESIQHIIDVHTSLVQLRYEHWLSSEAYSLVWWILLTGWLLPWAIWFCLVDRAHIVELTLYGTKIMFITTLLDACGTAQTLWIYTIKVIPFTPHLETIDWGVLPVIYMLVYQYFPSWKGFLTAQIVVALLFSLFGESFITNVLGSYLPLDWKSFYSLPLYLILAILPRASTKYLFGLERKTNSARERQP